MMGAATCPIPKRRITDVARYRGQGVEMGAMNAPGRSSSYPPCEDCGGVQVGNLQLGSGQGLGLWPRGHKVRGDLLPLMAVVCTACARVKFFVDSVHTLRDSLEKHPDWYQW